MNFKHTLGFVSTSPTTMNLNFLVTMLRASMLILTRSPGRFLSTIGRDVQLVTC